jgi:hypothetical protein
MSFGNVWGLVGLAAMAVPLIIHLFGRQQARRQRFPTLRFLAPSRLAPTRRRRLTDLLFLAIRMAVVAAAALALAQPRLGERAGSESREQTIARAIVVDTSASMSRLVSDGMQAVVVARREGARLAAEAEIATIIETEAPAAALAGAAAWLDRQPGRREVLIISDFQAGGLDSAALATIPPSLGVRLLPLAVPPEGLASIRKGHRVARVTAVAGRTDVEWAAVDRAARSEGSDLVLAGAAERSRAEAAMQAATVLGGGPPDTTRPVAIIYKEYGRRSDLLQRAKPVGRPWMGEAVARLHANPVLTDAAAMAEVPTDTSAYGSRFRVVARTAAGLPVVLASQGAEGSTDRLDLWLLADAGSLASAALIAAADEATSTAPPASELEPDVLSRELLRRLERPAGSPGRPAAEGQSDGRWFWLLALLLLGVEQVLRSVWRNGPGRSHDDWHAAGQPPSPAADDTVNGQAA